MQQEKRIVGRFVSWFKCNSCGYRELNEDDDVNILSDMLYEEYGEDGIRVALEWKDDEEGAFDGVGDY